MLFSRITIVVKTDYCFLKICSFYHYMQINAITVHVPVFFIV